MRLIYMDPGLHDSAGHHATTCRNLCAAFRQQGIESIVVSHCGIAADLKDELGAHGHFRAFTYAVEDDDPLCGWLISAQKTAATTEDDLALVQGLLTNDLIYLNSARPAQLLGLVRWAARQDTAPHMVVEFGDEPGVVFNVQGKLMVLNGDTRPILWRYVSRQIAPSLRPKLHLATFDPTISELYAQLLQHPVAVLPLPFNRNAAPDRAERPLRVIGIIGHQRPDKGYGLLPELLPVLLQRLPDAIFLVHNSVPDYMRSVHDELLALSRREPRVVMDERQAGPDVWQQILQVTDLLLCPYDPVRYAGAYSAIVGDAVANGIPAVVPAHTTLARTLYNFGIDVPSFTQWSPTSIADAVVQAAACFPVLNQQARAAALQWQQSMGPDKTAAAMLRLVG